MKDRLQYHLEKAADLACRLDMPVVARKVNEAINIISPRKVVALVIGHKAESPGAINVKHSVSEYDFNSRLAMQVKDETKKHDVRIIRRQRYKQLPHEINDLAPNYIISLHCNAFNSKVSGSEVLYYHKSSKGKAMANILLNSIVSHIQLHKRRIKACTSEDRGGYLLRETTSPCVIAEPFFIDNNNDLEHILSNYDALVSAYVSAIDEIVVAI